MKKLNKYCLNIDGSPYIFVSFKAKDEVADFIYSLHEEWNIHNVEEETGEDFINFLYENVSSEDALIYLDEAHLHDYTRIEFDF